MPLTKARFKKIFLKDVSDDLLAERKRKTEAAITELEETVEKLKERGADARPYEADIVTFKAEVAAAMNLGSTKKKYEKLESTKKDARNRAKSALAAVDYEPTQEDIDKVKNLLAEEGGLAKLNKQIADLGGDAKDAESRKLVIAAIKARWGLDKLSGDLTTKALPRLYKVMDMVPESHIKGNSKLKEIRRDRNSSEASFYSEDDDLIVLNLGRTGPWRLDYGTIDPDEGSSKFVSYFDHTTLHEIGHAIDAEMTFMDSNQAGADYGGWNKETLESVADAGGTDRKFFEKYAGYPHSLLLKFLVAMLKDGKPDSMKPDWVNANGLFRSAPTADDLGNDAGVMAAEALRVQYERDGWPDSTEAAFNSCSPKIKFRVSDQRAIARKVIEQILDKKLPIDAAVRAVLADLPSAVPSDKQWSEMIKHAGAQWCLTVRLKGKSSGLWEGGASAAAKAKVGTRVYQQSYATEWWSYELGARGSSVSQYQFRAPGEWFSEIYAAYYLGKLRDAKAKKWMEEEVHAHDPDAAVAQ
jgi:hypothetical protein